MIQCICERERDIDIVFLKKKIEKENNIKVFVLMYEVVLLLWLSVVWFVLQGGWDDDEIVYEVVCCEVLEEVGVMGIFNVRY